MDSEGSEWYHTLGVITEVVLSATRENTKLTIFMSPVLDPLAVAGDAFTTDWNRKKIYLFDPWNLFSRVLNKLGTFKGQTIPVTER